MTKRSGDGPERTAGLELPGALTSLERISRLLTDPESLVDRLAAWCGAQRAAYCLIDCAVYLVPNGSRQIIASACGGESGKSTLFDTLFHP